MSMIFLEFLNLMTWNSFLLKYCKKLKQKIFCSIFEGPNFALENPIDTLSPQFTQKALIRFLKTKQILERQNEFYPLM